MKTPEKPSAEPRGNKELEKNSVWPLGMRVSADTKIALEKNLTQTRPSSWF